MPEQRPQQLSVGGFDDAADDFLLLAPLLWDPVSLGTVEVTAPATGERVLDACCGVGSSALPAAVAVGGAGLVDAVDLSGPLVERAAARAADLPQLHAHTADVTAWPEDGYDLVQCVLGVFFFPDMDAGTRHLVGRARPGGRVGITVWRRGAVVAAGRALAAAVGRQRGAEVPAPEASARLDAVADPEGLAGWLAGCGAADVQVTTVEHALPTDPVSLWLLVTGSGYRGLLSGLSAEAVEAVRSDYLDQLAGGTPVDTTTLVALGRVGGRR
ncbi:class I SAM-dependent methyltransferase [Nakamurella endophytica]|uniref:Methyltransferase domain-containing protein n=1 Tax=Nakamurella endophytica TaxID=1748367 RepID=A0A917SUL3_9ACTN|nr:class I SAM-dependent methyltransferase [Nakamurella endophytica]GGL96809.1 hypothetical protein GCM10011594_15690 [Nakamurella endophytica]